MDRARLPHALRHYGGTYAGLGGPPSKTMEHVTQGVGNVGVTQGLPVCGHEFASGKGHLGPCEEGGGIGGGRELLESSKPGRHGAVWGPGNGGDEEGHLSPHLDHL